MRARHVSAAWVIALCMFAACTKNERLQTIHASVISVNVTLDELAVWDLDHRRELLEKSTSREDAIAKQDAYDEKFQRVDDARVLVYKALAVAATQTDGLSLTAALDAVKSLLDSIANLKKGGP